MASHSEVSTQAQGEHSARPVLAPGTTQATTTAQTARSTTTTSAASARTQRSIQPAPVPAPRPIQPAQKPRQIPKLKFPLQYVPAYTGPPNQAASRKPTTNGQSANQNQRNGFNSTATTAVTSRHYASRVAKEEEERRKSYYEILGEMDPYKGSPKEFIHLLVKAAMRDEEISKAIRRLNEERLQNPSSWTPVRPQDPSALERRHSSQPNHDYGIQNQQQNQQPNQQPQSQPMPNPHVQQQFPPGMTPGYGPQQPQMPQQMPHTVVYYVYPPANAGQPHQVIPGQIYGSPAPNMYPPYPQPQPPPGIGAPPQPPPPYAPGASQSQAGFPVAPNPVAPNISHTHQSPYTSIPPQPISRQPSTQQAIPSGEDGTSIRRNASTTRPPNSNDNVTNNIVDSDSNTNSHHSNDISDDVDEHENDNKNVSPNDYDSGDNNANGDVDTNPNEMDLDDEHPGPKEQSCNFTWVVDRAETQLGWTGNFEKESEIRQDTIGQSTAFKLQKLLKRMNAMIDKHITFRNRTHILTVMREVIMATLDTDSRVGSACRKNAKEYDDTFVDAVGKLTPEHKQRLKSLEDGKWMEEMQMLIEEANRKSMFPRLAEVPALLDT
ncbi:hypothetical protein F4781DRAFT_380982 [Annulohypoxylon bovei var. microspora]|nr:hypothetical protein F4781DRAFT_380982 [Annulohypoxylon bovei var. microspora]